jgi:hypothetical protein
VAQKAALPEQNAELRFRKGGGGAEESENQSKTAQSHQVFLSWSESGPNSTGCAANIQIFRQIFKAPA